MATWAWLLVCFGCLLLGHFVGALMATAGQEPLPPTEGRKPRRLDESLSKRTLRKSLTGKSGVSIDAAKLTAHLSGRILASHDEGERRYIDKVEWDSVDIRPRYPPPLMPLPPEGDKK